VDPILHEHRMKSFIIVGAAWSVKSQPGKGAVGICGLVMSMICLWSGPCNSNASTIILTPSVTVLADLEFIRVGLFVGDRTLCHTINTVHLVSTELTETVPVSSMSLESIQVGDVDLESITPTGFKHRSWEGVVEKDADFFDVAVR